MTTPPDHVVADAQFPAEGLSIAQTARRIGVSAAVLRVWELRYGWPRPERDALGYRRYPWPLITLLERVQAELQQGKTIGDLARDSWWQRVFETGRLPEPVSRTRVEPPWSSLPLPTSVLGRDVRTRLQQALVAADARMAQWAQAMGERLHPSEREYAVKAVLRMWHQHQQHPHDLRLPQATASPSIS